MSKLSFFKNFKGWFNKSRFNITSDKSLDLTIESARKNLIISNRLHGILKGAISLRKIKSRDVMMPLSKIHYLTLKSSTAAILEKIAKTNHSRFPIFSNDNAVVGILLAKEYLQKHTMADFNIQNIMRNPYIISESHSIAELLQEFRNRRYHMAIVIDEYRAVSGLVTIEDILEEIVGEIYDETDSKQLFYQELAVNKYIVNADVELKLFNEKFKTKLSSSSQDTLAGFLIELNNGIMPRKKQKLEYGKLKFIVDSGNDRKIEKIKVSL